MSNVTAQLTIRLNAIGDAGLARLVANLDKSAHAAAVAGSQLKGTELEVAKLAAKAPGLRTLEAELVKLGRDAEQTKIKMAAREIFHGPAGEPPIVGKLRTVENEMTRLQRQMENRSVTKAAQQALGLDPNFLDGHGYTSWGRKVLGVARDAGTALMGVRYGMLAIGAAGHAMVDPFREYEKLMAQVETKGGFTAAQMIGLKAQTRDLGRSTMFGPRQSAEAMVELAAAGVRSEGMGAALPSTLKFSQATGLATGESSAALVETMSQFKLAIGDFKHIGDVLITAADSSTISVTDLRETLKYVGPVAASAGMSLEKTAAVIALIGESGIKGTQAGTGLKEILVSLVDPSKKAKEALAGIGIDRKAMDEGIKNIPAFLAKLDKAMKARNLSNPRRLEIEAQVFGERALPDVEAIISGLGRLDSEGVSSMANFENATAHASDGIGAMEARSQRMGNTLDGALKRLSSTTQTLAIDLGEKLAPGLEVAIQKVTPAIKAIGDFVASNGELVATAAGVAGAIGIASITGALPASFAALKLTAKAFAWAAGFETGTTFGAAFGTVAGAAASAAAVLAMGMIGYMIGTWIADKINAQALGAQINHALHGDDPGVKEVNDRIAARNKAHAEHDAKRAEAFKTDRAQIDGQINLIVEDDRIRVKTHARGLPIKTVRTGVNVNPEML